MSTHGASNEVWWSPYPTNLQPPVHTLTLHWPWLYPGRRALDEEERSTASSDDSVLAVVSLPAWATWQLWAADHE